MILRDTAGRLLLGVLLSSPCLGRQALAQTASATAEGTDRASDAAVSDDLVQARARFRAASTLAEAGEWRRALTAYEEAFRLHAHATTLYNIGYCHAQLGHATQALYYTTRALDTEAFDEDRRLGSERRSVAEAQAHALLRQLAKLTLSTSEDDVVLRVNARPLVVVRFNDKSFLVPRPEGVTKDASSLENGAELYLDAGTHELELSAGALRETQSLSVHAGDQRTLIWPPIRAALPVPSRPAVFGQTQPTDAASRQLAATPTQTEAPQASITNPPNPLPEAQYRQPSLYRRAGLTSLTLGAAGFTLALVSGIVTLSADRHLSRVCDDGLCPEAESGSVQRYRWGARLTNVGLLIGVVGGAAGTGLLLLDPPPKETVTLSVTPGQLELTTTF